MNQILIILLDKTFFNEYTSLQITNYQIRDQSIFFQFSTSNKFV